MPNITQDDIPPFFTLTPAQLKDTIFWFESMCGREKWNLSKAEKLRLLGNISDQQYCALQANDTQSSELLQTVIERLSLLLGISKCIVALVGRTNAIEIFNKPNANKIFASKSIREFLLEGDSTENYYLAKKYLLNAMNK